MPPRNDPAPTDPHRQAADAAAEAAMRGHTVTVHRHGSWEEPFAPGEPAARSIYLDASAAKALELNGCWWSEMEKDGRSPESADHAVVAFYGIASA